MADLENNMAQISA